jgi:hypothetical protein
MRAVTDHPDRELRTRLSELYVSKAHAGANAGSVSAYRVSSNATLEPIGNSPFADKQTAFCWVEITPDGRFLFTVNTGVRSISRYKLMSNGGLSLLGSTAFKLVRPPAPNRPSPNQSGAGHPLPQSTYGNTSTTDNGRSACRCQFGVAPLVAHAVADSSPCKNVWSPTPDTTP